MKNLSNVNLTAQRACEAVARLGALRAAADELGVTPGAISQHVIKAEAQLGRVLFERLPKGMVTTSIGSELTGYLTSGFDALSRGVAATQRGPTDAITISVAPVFAAKWLVRRLGSFADAHPTIRVRIAASGTRIDPRPGDVDACIRVGFGDWAGVASEEIVPQSVFPVCAPSVAARVRTPSDLTNVPIIRERKNTLFSWDTWLNPNDMSSKDLGDGPIFSDASLCLDAAAAGQGVFLTMDALGHDALAMGQLVAPLPGRFPSGASYWFVEPEGAKRPPFVRAFREWLFDAMRSKATQK